MPAGSSYLRGEPEVRFWNKVGMGPNGCWVWLGSLTNGYGVFWDGENKVRAHRYSWELNRGLIPDGYQADHLCRNRRCVNPDHLEPVTQAVNLRRQADFTTHCPQRHEYTEANTRRNRYGYRNCKTCARDYMRRRALTKLEAE